MMHKVESGQSFNHLVIYRKLRSWLDYFLPGWPLRALLAIYVNLAVAAFFIEGYARHAHHFLGGSAIRSLRGTPLHECAKMAKAMAEFRLREDRAYEIYQQFFMGFGILLGVVLAITVRPNP